MKTVKKAIYDILNTPVITKSLSVYTGTNEPALFTLPEPPDDAHEMCVTIKLDGGPTFYDKANFGADVSLTVTLHTGRSQTLARGESVAVKIWETINRNMDNASVTGYTVPHIEAEFPREELNDLGFVDYIISVTMKIEKE